MAPASVGSSLASFANASVASAACGTVDKSAGPIFSAAPTAVSSSAPPFRLKNLYVDLDGVLADFEAGVLKQTGRSSDSFLASPSGLSEMWEALRTASPPFFSSLELMPDALQLWDHVRRCRPAPVILTGLPRGSWAIKQKEQWVAEKLGPEVHVICCSAHEKALWSRRGAVLIDDSDKHRKGWEGNKGVFILHKSAESSIAALQALLKEGADSEVRGGRGGRDRGYGKTAGAGAAAGAAQRAGLVGRGGRGRASRMEDVELASPSEGPAEQSAAGGAGSG